MVCGPPTCATCNGSRSSFPRGRLHVRVSTDAQTLENQIRELRTCRTTRCASCAAPCFLKSAASASRKSLLNALRVASSDPPGFQQFLDFTLPPYRGFHHGGVSLWPCSSRRQVTRHGRQPGGANASVGGSSLAIGFVPTALTGFRR